MICLMHECILIVPCLATLYIVVGVVKHNEEVDILYQFLCMRDHLGSAHCLWFQTWSPNFFRYFESQDLWLLLDEKRMHISRQEAKWIEDGETSRIGYVLSISVIEGGSGVGVGEGGGENVTHLHVSIMKIGDMPST